MSNVTQPIDFSDLWNALILRARVDSNQTINAQTAKQFINTALFDMHLGHGEKFPWAERQSRLLTHEPYETGTVSATKGSATITGSSTAWNTFGDFGVRNVRAGGRFVFPGDDTVYEVQSVTNDTTVVLTDAYRGEDIAGETYTYFEDEYDLATDFLKPFDKTSFSSRGDIEIMDRREFRRRFTVYAAPGEVVRCAIFDRAFSGSTAPRRRVRFFRPPGDTRYIPYAYVTSSLAVTSAGEEQAQLVDNTDEPIVPLYARHLIVLKALEHWYRDKKNDSRTDAVALEYREGISRLLDDVETGAQRPRLQPRVGSYKRNAAQPYSGGRSRRYVTGPAFDENR